MKFYKRQSIDQHNPQSDTWSVTYDGNILTNTKGSMELPSGGTSDRPTSIVDGQLRYNQTLKDAEEHVNGVWERVRTVRPATIVVQNLGSGNYMNSYFGPLNPDYEPSYAKSPANIMVYVDNVYQIPGQNYGLTLTAPADFQLSTTQDAAIGDTVLTLTTITNIMSGMQISGPGAIQPNTTIVSIQSTSTQSQVVISMPLVDNIAQGTAIDFTYSTGTYIVFSGAVPMKPVVALLGTDGYFPPS